MWRITCIILIALLVLPSISNGGTIDIQIRGIDDGEKTTKQRDYKEAVLSAKREAIERAGIKIKAIRTFKDLVENSDYIESQAGTLLLPGYSIMDIGYQEDGTYLVMLVGKVKTVSDGLDLQELRCAESVIERGEKSKGKEIITDIINNSKDDDVEAEAIDIETLEKPKAYYPNSKYVSGLELVVAKRDAERIRLEAKIGRVIGRDGRFLAGDRGVILDTKTRLIWAARDNGEDINWADARIYCENYRGAGYTDWRMPTLDELAGIYDEKENRYGHHVTRLIDISRCCPWALETRGSKAAYFNFYDGERYWYARSYSGNLRALPVRVDK